MILIIWPHFITVEAYKVDSIVITPIFQMKQLKQEMLNKHGYMFNKCLELGFEPRQSGFRVHTFNHCSILPFKESAGYLPSIFQNKRLMPQS